MKESYRALLAFIAIAFIVLLNALYLVSYFSEKKLEFSEQVDTPPIQLLSLMLLFLLVVFSAIKPKESS